MKKEDESLHVPINFYQLIYGTTVLEKLLTQSWKKQDEQEGIHKKSQSRGMRLAFLRHLKPTPVLVPAFSSMP